MGFDEEWVQALSSAKSDAATGMNLAQTGSPAPGGHDRLATSASDKKRAARYMEEELLPDTQAAGRMADGGGAAAVRPPLLGPPPTTSSVMKPDTGLAGLSDWAVDKGLSEAMSTWQGQVQRLMGTLGAELGALRGTNTAFQGNELTTGSRFGALESGVRRPGSSRIEGL
ncbi:hypothetical protein [Streptomyces boninensis]|uniref:hypothetical protein n=1 Tax=Streptomyces boninensis TaxID=2039455 RepID=UPI003B219821